MSLIVVLSLVGPKIFNLLGGYDLCGSLDQVSTGVETNI